MKRLSIAALVALGLVLSLPLAQAKGHKDKGDPNLKHGSIQSVDAANNSFVLSMKVKKEAQTATIKITDKTTYTLDGAASTKDNVLKEGLHVQVTVDPAMPDTATEVAAMTTGKGGKKHKNQ